MHGKPEGNEKNLTDKEEKPEVDYADFQKLKFRVGTIIEAELVPDTKNLIKLIVDIGETEKRTIVAGIGKNYSPDELIGTQVVVLTNLKPKTIRKIKSSGMILSADLKKKGAALLRPIDDVENGTNIK